jgi:predicted CoA-binding protein
MPLTSADDIAHLLSRVRFIALVGASDRPDRPSYRVMRFLQTHGYRVFPVNPQLAGQEIHGSAFTARSARSRSRSTWSTSSAVPRRGEAVDEAIAIGAKSVWLQLGVINQEAADRAEAAGLEVVMDRCPAIDIPATAPANVALPMGGE